MSPNTVTPLAPCRGCWAAGSLERAAPGVLLQPDSAPATATATSTARHPLRTGGVQDGVRVAAEYRPEVVVCDIGLPGMDGYAVAGALRRNPATAASRLIALTGYGREEDRRRAREAGFDEHLTKPADPAALEAILTGAAD